MAANKVAIQTIRALHLISLCWIFEFIIYVGTFVRSEKINILISIITSVCIMADCYVDNNTKIEEATEYFVVLSIHSTDSGLSFQNATKVWCVKKWARRVTRAAWYFHHVRGSASNKLVTSYSDHILCSYISDIFVMSGSPGSSQCREHHTLDHTACPWLQQASLWDHTSQLPADIKQRTINSASKLPPN